jgi:hypothetical protein
MAGPAEEQAQQAGAPPAEPLPEQWEVVVEAPGVITDDLLLKDEHAEKFKCAVCLEVMLQPVALVPCGHAICKPCATRVLAGKARPGVRSTRKCPTCRQVSTG